MGDRGVSARVWLPRLRWHGRMMTADSSQCDTPPKNLPHPHLVSLWLFLSFLTSPHPPCSSHFFSPFSMHADCGPIIAPAPVWKALHFWKSPCGQLFVPSDVFGWLTRQCCNSPKFMTKVFSKCPFKMSSNGTNTVAFLDFFNFTRNVIFVSES